ncbi:MAG TPA: universal stress protein [Bryobacteraceae bacterium]|nr:universal stress protein [Bryobacteraceae bacterium]
MRVLLATDGSSGASEAARTAGRILRPEHHHMELLCVEPEYPPRMTGWDESAAGRLRLHRILDETRQLLDGTAGVLSANGIHAKKHCEIGWPPAVISAASGRFDLTVVGSEGQGAHSEAGLGPVANHVLHHAAGSVLIGRKLHSETGFRVLVALDGSLASIRALRAVTTLLDLESAEVTLMNVAETSWIHLGIEYEWIRFRDRIHDPIEPEIEWDRQVRLEGQRLLDHARERILPYHPAVEMEVAEGIPSSEILSEADKRDCDLIVLGATGATELKHQLLGSTSHRIAWDAGCSVLVVRPPSVNLGESTPEQREIAQVSS